MFMFCQQIAGQNHYKKVADKYFQNVAKLKCLGMMVTNQNCIHEEIKSRLNSGNACYHAVHNLLSSQLLSKNVKVKIYRTVILPLVLYRCETSLHYGKNTDWWCLRTGCLVE
jgi:hypothetical protein